MDIGNRNPASLKSSNKSNIRITSMDTGNGTPFLDSTTVANNEIGS